jgi:hypothetical protein
VFKRGWEDYESIWHWTSKQEAAVYFVNEGEDGREFEGSLLVGTAVPRHIEILTNGRPVADDDLKTNQVKSVVFRVAAKRGPNEVVFKTDALPPPKGGTVPPATFKVGNVKFTAKP